MKSTVDEIRQRFDADVERFSNLDTGQSATVDAPLAMALVAQAAAATTPHAGQSSGSLSLLSSSRSEVNDKWTSSNPCLLGLWSGTSEDTDGTPVTHSDFQ